MIESVSSWICDKRELQIHISMISKSFLSFSTQFMTKRKKNSEFIALIIKTRKKTVQVEFFKEISQRITVFVTKTRDKTFQIIFLKKISHRIAALIINIRYRIFQVRFFREISRSIVREREITIWNEIKLLLSSRFRRSWLSSFWSKEISLSLCSKEISFNVSKFKTQTNRRWSELNLCVTRKSKTFDSIQRFFAISIILKEFYFSTLKIRIQSFNFSILCLFISIVMKRSRLSTFKIRQRFTILYSTSLSQREQSQRERSQWERLRFVLNF
jgi:hypothetical protein